MGTTKIQRNRWKAAVMFFFCLLMALAGLALLGSPTIQTEDRIKASFMLFLFIPIGLLFLKELLTNTPLLLLDEKGFRFYGSPFKVIAYEWQDIQLIRYVSMRGPRGILQEYIDIKLVSTHPLVQATRKRTILSKLNTFPPFSGEVQLSLNGAKGISCEDCIRLMNQYRLALKK